MPRVHEVRGVAVGYFPFIYVVSWRYGRWGSGSAWVDGRSVNLTYRPSPACKTTRTNFTSTEWAKFCDQWGIRPISLVAEATKAA